MTHNTFDSDEEITKPEFFLHEPLRLIERKATRLVKIMIVVAGLSLFISVFLLIWQTVYLQEWRIGNRAIINDIQIRVRVIEEMEKQKKRLEKN